MILNLFVSLWYWNSLAKTTAGKSALKKTLNTSVTRAQVKCEAQVILSAFIISLSVLLSKMEIDGPGSNYQDVLGSFMDYLSLSNEGFFQMVFIKLPIVCAPQGQIINKIFPSINHICIIGQTQSSINSLFKVWNISVIFLYKMIFNINPIDIQ